MSGRSSATKFYKEIDTTTKDLEHLEEIISKIILDFLKFNFEGTFNWHFFSLTFSIMMLSFLLHFKVPF